MARPTSNHTYGAVQRKQPLKAAAGARTVGRVYFPAASARTHAMRRSANPAGAVEKPSSPVAAHGQAWPAVVRMEGGRGVVPRVAAAFMTLPVLSLLASHSQTRSVIFSIPVTRGSVSGCFSL